MCAEPITHLRSVTCLEGANSESHLEHFYRTQVGMMVDLGGAMQGRLTQGDKPTRRSTRSGRPHWNPLACVSAFFLFYHIIRERVGLLVFSRISLLSFFFGCFPPSCVVMVGCVSEGSSHSFPKLCFCARLPLHNLIYSHLFQALNPAVTSQWPVVCIVQRQPRSCSCCARRVVSLAHCRPVVVLFCSPLFPL